MVSCEGMTLQEFLIDRKMKLLTSEKHARGSAKASIIAQIQMSDSVLMFLASKQTEEDMAKLQLSLDKQAKPLSELKPRQENEELTDALIELAASLDPDSYKPINNIPDGVKHRSVSAKVYSLREAGKLKPNIKPITRGKELFLARVGE